tara:strand:+ start:753 stop:1049 length:297 start_codon:yes stop_codon:yes gene_type:complete
MSNQYDQLVRLIDAHLTELSSQDCGPPLGLSLDGIYSNHEWEKDAKSVLICKLVLHIEDLGAVIDRRNLLADRTEKLLNVLSPALAARKANGGGGVCP